MRGVFSDLYNKVLSFFKTEEPVGEETKLAAKSRLKTVLMQDRVGFSERAMQMLKEDLIQTISKYMDIEVDELDLAIEATDDKSMLSLSIPVINAKTDEEIDEAIKEQDEKTSAKAQEIVEELEELIKERAAELAGVAEDDKDVEEQDENTEDNCENSESEDESKTEEDKQENEVEEVQENKQETTSDTKKKKQKKVKAEEN